MEERTAVLGLGNILRRDDGYGPAVTYYLSLLYKFEPEIEVVEVGAPGLDLAPFVSGVENLLLVDTANVDGNPGEIRVLDRDQILGAAERKGPMISGHQSDLYAAIWKADWTGEGPKMVQMVACIPEDLEEGSGLSKALTGVIPEGIETSLKILQDWGIQTQKLQSFEDVKPPWWFEKGAT